jgi:hypothetical protein
MRTFLSHVDLARTWRLQTTTTRSHATAAPETVDYDDCGGGPRRKKETIPAVQQTMVSSAPAGRSYALL